MADKSILVMNTPENCDACACAQIAFDSELFREGEPYCIMKLKSVEENMYENRPDWCPLKPMPEKKGFWEEEYGGKFSEGWNACIDEITGGERVMEDRYLFRAKRIGNGEWYEGYLIKDADGDFQIFKNGCRNTVLPDTICQCTGLKDKNGNTVFENDIMSAHLDDMYPDDVTYVQVVWNLNGFYTKENGSKDLSPLEEFDTEHFTVCGNIFDNLDLLER